MPLFFDHAKIEQIVRRFPELMKPVEAIIGRELANSVNRWSRAELERLQTSFPGLADDLAAVVLRQLENPANRWSRNELIEIGRSFPAVKKRVAMMVASMIEIESVGEMSHDELYGLVNDYPDLRPDVVRTLGRHLAAPRREFDLAELAEMAASFDEVSEAANRRAELIVEEKAREATIRDLELLLFQYPALEPCVRTVQMRNFPALAQRSELADLRQWMQATGNEEPADPAVRDALVAKGHEFPVPEQTLGEWAWETARGFGIWLVREYWHYLLAGFGAAFGVLYIRYRVRRWWRNWQAAREARKASGQDSSTGDVADDIRWRTGRAGEKLAAASRSVAQGAARLEQATRGTVGAGREKAASALAKAKRAGTKHLHALQDTLADDPEIQPENAHQPRVEDAVNAKL